LNFNLNILIDSLLLINISIPNFNSQLSIGKLLFIIDEFNISLRDYFQILNHLVKNADFLFDHIFIFFV
jgi:hypothetical protein